MHIITGLAIGALLGLKKDKKQKGPPLLAIKGILESKHSLPGRERLYIPSLRRSVAKKELILKEMPKLQGIKSMEASEITGSVLICYDSSVINPSLIAAALIKLLDLEKEILKTPRAAVREEFNHIMDSLDRAIYEKSSHVFDLSTMISFTFLGLVIRNAILKKPLNIAFLWWGYNLLKDKKGR